MTTQTTTKDAIEIARELAAEFRTRAAEYDRNGAFPMENYDRMRESGYLRAPVPEELGGLGATLPQMARAQQELARGCASTALAVNMHQFQVGAAADGFRKTGANEAPLRRVANEGIVLDRQAPRRSSRASGRRRRRRSGAARATCSTGGSSSCRRRAAWMSCASTRWTQRRAN
jgi:alkylation response protein AidB-like acyl-CoA dehydrogenase